MKYIIEDIQQLTIKTVVEADSEDEARNKWVNGDGTIERGTNKVEVVRINPVSSLVPASNLESVAVESSKTVN